MSERGPDAATLQIDRNVAFGHRRLAIRDQKTGHQPIYSPDRNYLIVYNGEIYNDSELRSKLRKQGHSFRGYCDTEILAAAWQEWQEDTISMLRGMFAFGVYDFRRNRLTLVRDRLGVKPLFYAWIGNEFVFASTVAAITKHPKFVAAPDLTTIRHYLSTCRITFDSQTMFQGINTVKPAELIHCDADSLEKKIYWQPPAADHKPDLCFEEAVDQLEQTLREAVDIRLTSDVPVGMMLSGGVDSNSLAHLMSEQRPGGFDSVCGGGKADDFKSMDFDYAEKCAASTNIQLSKVELDNGAYQESWKDLVSLLQTPLSTPSDVIINQIAHRLKQTVGVAIGGEGADEACCGYEVPHWSGADFDLWNNTSGLDSHQLQVARSSLSGQYGRHPLTTPGDFYLACNSLIPRQVQSKMFKSNLWCEADSDRGIEKYYDALFDELPSMTNAEKSAHVLIKTNLESLLARLDSATMSASLESRVPYTDHILVEQLFRLPHSYRIDISPQEKTPWLSSLELSQRGSLRPKRLIHNLAQRIMPKSLAARRKSSFSTPVPLWLNGQWKKWADHELASSDFLKEIFEPNVLSHFEQLPSELSLWKWPMVNLSLWGKNQFA